MANLEAHVKASHVFSPAAPVGGRGLFAGRQKQVQDLIDVFYQPGRHAVIYGESGVGKTSLAIAAATTLDRSRLLSVRVSCDSGDTINSIWSKVIAEFADENRLIGEPEIDAAVAAVSSSRERGSLGPDDIRRFLRILGQRRSVRLQGQITTVFVDEFDRLEDKTTRSLFADTIKMLSDYVVPTTVVVIGIADRADQLLTGHHRSLERVLAEIHLPRMVPAESSEIIRTGLTKLGMSITEEAAQRVVQVSCGLPYYVHLLCQWAVLAAVEANRGEVATADVDAAIAKVLKGAPESAVDTYIRATFTPKESSYAHVLLACALANTDELGYFSLPAVRDALEAITGRQQSVLGFSRQLKSLLGERGPVLQENNLAGVSFRFVDPLLQPLVIMRALASDLVSRDLLIRLR